MASCGVAVTDHTDDIIFHPSGGGTGYVAYDNFEERIETKGFAVDSRACRCYEKHCR